MWAHYELSENRSETQRTDSISSSRKCLPPALILSTSSTMCRTLAISTIRLLSLFLHELAPGKPISRNGGKDRELSLFNHISTLLNTGSPNSLVLAVTGQLSPQDFIVTVVVSSNSTSNAKPKSSYTITGVTPSVISMESLIHPSS